MKNHVLAFVAICILFASCQSEKRKLVESAPLISASYTDDTGRELDLPYAPRRVVSIAPNITETIFAIGGEEKLIARSQACDYPPEAEDIPVVTTYPTLDKEELVATEADIVLTTNEIFSDEAVTQLEELGIPVFLQEYKEMKDIYRGIRNAGRIAGA